MQQKRPRKYTYQSGDQSFKKDEHISEEQNKTFKEAFDYIIQKNSYVGHRIKGGYLIAYSLEFARNLTSPGEGDPRWQDLRDENAHIGIAVHDANDLHFIEGLSVNVTVIDEEGYVVGTLDHPLLERPNLYHYGRNWKLPGDGKYTLRIKVETPEFYDAG